MHDDPATPAATADTDTDVLIMGGGLAGLTLALQLRQAHPALRIRVLERRTHPVPLAAHKVGESTVELAAHYFAHVLGLREHLESAQIRKFGFRFFFSEGLHDLSRCTELGASRALPTVSWQIDRGLFENHLGEQVRQRGIDFIDGARVSGLRLAGEGGEREAHDVQWLHEGRSHTCRARWLVDACGRAGLLKPRLGLAQPNEHPCHAVWFRVKHRIAFDDWCADAAWRSRCTPPERWRSTNHLVGAGYWVWLIPLSSGSHSVGIVADPRLHPLEGMNTYDKALQWLRVHQPRLHAELEPQRQTVQDFAFFKRFSYGCKQVYSAARWALTGEAGLFLDPFYSPGSDFIAISNTFVADLIARDLARAPLAGHAAMYDQIFHSFYDNTMALYLDQYALFGNAEVLPVKVLWDYSYYWGVLCPLFIHGRLTDLRMLSTLRDELALAQRLNQAVQPLLRAWGALGAPADPGGLLDQAALPWFHELNARLEPDPSPTDAEFRTLMRTNVSLLVELAQEVAQRATERATQRGASLEDAAAALRAALDTPAARDLAAGPTPGGSASRLFAPPLAQP
ncbi:MAG: tryptophan 7-halogenase [Aquabacterium sp.]|jgi:flavin-dependent dehydrogenase|nr:tryptophan 7-halogenase [Aquabacterium sp.]